MATSLSETTIGVALVARLTLGIFFFISSIGKIRNRDDFLNEIVSYEILPNRLAVTFGSILPWAELMLALALILGVALRLTGILTMGLLIIFIFAVVTNLRRGRKIGCGCYGVSGTKAISWGTILRNICLIGLSSILVVVIPDSNLNTSSITSWATDLELLSTLSMIPVLMLTAFCVVTISLLEWVFEIKPANS